MLDANRLILDTIEPRCEGELKDAQIDGRVVIEAGAQILRSTIRGPAIIGAGAKLTDAYLDGRVESSLLGRNVRINRDSHQPRAYRFMVGDNSEIAVP